MIELAPHTAVMLYLGTAIAAILVIWLSRHFKTREERIETNDNKLITCEYCLSPYLCDIEKKVSQCPKCHSFNKSS